MDVLKRQRRGWYLFQFSSELLLTNGLLYFLPWLTSIGLSDNWYNSTLVVSSILLILSGPLLGRLEDRKHRGYYYLSLTSLVMFACTLGIHLADRNIDSRLFKGVISLVCFGTLMYSYQIGLVFYNVMLRRLSSVGDYMKPSGWGVAAGWLGAIVGILLILPFVEGWVPWFQPGGKSQAFLPSAVLYGIVTMVSLSLMRGIEGGPSSRESQSATSNESQLKSLEGPSQVSQKDIWFFLVALFLFADAVLTIESNASYYLLNVMGFSQDGTMGLFVLLVLMAAAGALIPARLRRRVTPKQMLFGILIGWVLTLLAVTVTRNQILFAVLFAIIGLLYVALANVMRDLLLSLLPANRTGNYFGYYVSFQRCSTLIGPLVWMGSASISGGLGTDRYRISMLAMAGLICLSFLFLRKLSSLNPQHLNGVGASESQLIHQEPRPAEGE
jgi:UMF1 family MFS transporter